MYHLDVCTCPSRPFSSSYEDLLHASMNEPGRRASERLSDFKKCLEETKKAREKIYITLEEFRDAKDICSIDRILRNSKYPEDDESPSGQQFVPVLLLRRCKIMVKSSGKVKLRYDLLLKDLHVIEHKWLEFLPESVHYDLFYLKTFCQMKLSLFADAKESHDKALEVLADANLDEKMLDKKREKLSVGLKNIQRNNCTNKPNPKIPKYFPKIAHKNSDYPTLSKSLTITEYRTSGSLEKPKVFAKDDIQPGEIVAVEKAMFQMALPVISGCQAKEVCHFCLTDTFYISYPCSECCLVIFCSIICRDFAWNSFHKHECKTGIEMMRKGQLFQIFVSGAMRMIFTLGRHAWLKSVGAFNEAFVKAVKSRPMKGMEALAVLGLVCSDISDKVASTLDIPAVTDLLHIFARDKLFLQIERNRIAILASKHVWQIVKDSGFMDPISPDLEEHSLDLIERLCGALSCGMRQVRPASTDLYKSLNMDETVYVTGMAAHKTISVLSHSCLPNASYFEGDDGTTVVVANRLIVKGEEITIPYIFEIFEDQSVRKNPLLLFFGVECSCVACSKGWGRAEYSSEGIEKRLDMKKAFRSAESRLTVNEDGVAKLEDCAELSLRMRKRLSPESYVIWSNMFATDIQKSVSSTPCKCLQNVSGH